MTFTNEPVKRIAIVTCAEHPNLYADEQAIVGNLRRRDVDASPVVWNDPTIRWSTFDRIVLRSVWDYWLHADAFHRWLDRLADETRQVYNAVSLLRWNLDKRYLSELHRNGVSTIPTKFIRADGISNIEELVAASGWQDVVVKPAISGGAFRTRRIAATRMSEITDAVRDILPQTALIQPFAAEIEEGELSLVFFRTKFSHAVLKVPKRGDFRVQSDFGGSFRAVKPSARTIASASRIIDLLPSKPVYVRIDGIERNDEFILMEVEAIDPYLFMRGNDAAMTRYLDAITEV